MTAKNTATVILKMPPDLKAAAMEAIADKRGGLSQVIRELLASWLAKQKKQKSD